MNPRIKGGRDALPKHQGARGGSLSRWFGVEQGDASSRKGCPIPARRLSPRSDLEDEDTVRAWDVHVHVHPRIVSTRGAGRIVAARLGTLPFHKDKVQLMSGAAMSLPANNDFFLNKKKENQSSRRSERRVGRARRLWSETWRIRRGEEGVGSAGWLLRGWGRLDGDPTD